ncbi:hypothetical protein HRM2_05570 [Desulforapulum autotrophicum HRM2]|uniref:Uncharacterized protein n=1 Tax=Desulforapulum autotrophicum (strain ATCC 43914 / DSM 3382 / VKM B-1955 / HRM2) TaxID=177437 RepID=C0QHW3_DESAH|nr:hypothetical protein HRM2_05570 [Desulforapulum autotrophicum HRM2]
MEEDIDCACFNPCCRGSGIPGTSIDPCDSLTIMFQSLLSWIRHSRIAADRSSPYWAIGFNPCCRGSGIPGCFIFSFFVLRTAFQSLLSWIRHSRQFWSLVEQN